MVSQPSSELLGEVMVERISTSTQCPILGGVYKGQRPVAASFKGTITWPIGLPLWEQLLYV